MRRQGRCESARAWIASGAAVTITTYARRYGVDRYTAYQDLTAIGFPLPDSAQRWAHRPPPRPRPRRSAAPRALLDNDQITLDGWPYFVAGYTPGGAPYGTFRAAIEADDGAVIMVERQRVGRLRDDPDREARSPRGHDMSCYLVGPGP